MTKSRLSSDAQDRADLVDEAEIVGATPNGTAESDALVVETKTGTVKVFDAPSTRTLLTYLQERAVADDDETAAVWESIATEVFSAKTVAEILSGGVALGAQDILDEPLIIESIDYRQSDMAEGLPYYAVLHVRRPRTGSKFAVTCGGLRVVMQCVALERLDALPAEVMIQEAARPTRQGYKPLRLTLPTPF